MKQHQIVADLICPSDISVFKSKDGTCLVFSQAKSELHPANGKVDSQDSLENVWIWKRLCVLDAGEVREVRSSRNFYSHLCT